MGSFLGRGEFMLGRLNTWHGALSYNKSVMIILKFIKCCVFFALVTSADLSTPRITRSFEGKTYYYSNVTGQSQWERPGSVSKHSTDKVNNSHFRPYIYIPRRPTRRHTVLGDRSQSAVIHNQSLISKENSTDSYRGIQNNNPLKVTTQYEETTDSALNIPSLDKSNTLNRALSSSANPDDFDYFENHLDFLESQIECLEEKLDAATSEGFNLKQKVFNCLDEIGRLLFKIEIMESNINSKLNETKVMREQNKHLSSRLTQQSKLIFKLEERLEKALTSHKESCIKKVKDLEDVIAEKELIISELFEYVDELKNELNGTSSTNR